MIRIFTYIVCSFIWMETVYHIAAYGLTGMTPFLMIGFAVFVAAFETLFVNLSKKSGVNIGILWGFQSVNLFLFAAQLVYYKIFTRPLLLEIAFTTGADAITDFWSIALDGILNSVASLMIMALPLIVMAFLLKKKVLVLEQYTKPTILKNCGLIFSGLLLVTLILIGAYYSKDEFYAEYQEFYAPEEVAKECGALALYGRQMMFDLLPEKETDLLAWQDDLGSTEGTEEVWGTEAGTEIEENEVVTGPVMDTSPNVLNIDFDALIANGDKNIDKMAEIMQSMTPSNKNEYTGMMKGYNLIYITAEAFSPYAVSEELTPTLYQMMNSGVVVKDYYIPLWATSTSDGEYVNLMGQIPDGQHSFRRTQYNTYPYALPAYFAAEGVTSYAYHSNSLSYYDRYLTHPNLGYDFKAALLGKLSKSKWGDKVFEMEDAKS